MKSNKAIVLGLVLPVLTVFAIVGATSLAVAGTPDFTVAVSQSSLCTNPGLQAKTAVTLASLNGYVGTVNLGGTVDPSGPSLSGIPSSVTLQSGQSAVFDAIVTTSHDTAARVYTVTVSGLSGASLHQASFQLAVGADCTVGGTILQQSSSGSLLPFAVLATIAVAIPAALLGIYLRRRTSEN